MSRFIPVNCSRFATRFLSSGHSPTGCPPSLCPGLWRCRGCSKESSSLLDSSEGAKGGSPYFERSVVNGSVEGLTTRLVVNSSVGCECSHGPSPPACLLFGDQNQPDFWSWRTSVVKSRCSGTNVPSLTATALLRPGLWHCHVSALGDRRLK